LFLSYKLWVGAGLAKNIVKTCPSLLNGLKIMTKYVLWGSYCEDVLEKRTPYRQAHLDGLAKQKEAGILITVGPTQDLTQVFAIYEAPDRQTVKKLVESDPYWLNGIWTAYEIKEWIQVF
jgi:uncharacterized protein YciI